MKKKQPTLTHYTKRLKKVRLARTITVIATLFVSGVVVAANVLPQVVKSNASVVPDTTNDVVNGGVNQWDGSKAKSELIAKVFNGTSNEAKSAKALYTKLGISQSDVQGATYKWLYGPNVTGTKVNPNDSITKYGDWRSFGRNPGTGFTLYPVDYSATAPAKSPADFYYKAHKLMFSTWASGTSAEPVLMGNGWFIALECGNPVIQTIPSNPSINFTKSAVSVTRGSKTFTEAEVKAGSFKLQVKDQITYRLTGKNGNVIYPAGLRLIDQIPTGTKLVSQGGDGWPGTTLTKVANATVNGKPAVAWDFSAIPANQGGYTDFKVEVTAVTSQICNVALYGKPGNLPVATNPVCLSVGKPTLTIEKGATSPVPSDIKVGTEMKYQVKMTNTGAAEAPGAVALDILRRDATNGERTQDFKSVGTPTLTVNGTTRNLNSSEYTAVVDAATQKQYANGNADAYGIRVNSLPAGGVVTFTITTKLTKIPAKVDNVTATCDFAVVSMTGSTAPLGIEAKTPNVCLPVGSPRISVVKTSPTANRNVSRGQTINYDVVVKNNSSQFAQTSEVTVTDTFTPPGAFKNLKQSSSASFSGLAIKTTQSANGFVWKIAKIPANGVVTIKISATVVDDAADATKVCNNATITMTPGNPVVSETSSTVCNTVSLIKLNKTAKYVNRSDDPQKSAARAGDEIEYTLTTTNQASSPAVDYVVTEDLTDVLMYADVTDNGGGTLTESKLIWAPKTIPAGGKITNTFKVTVKDPVPNNQASSTNPTGYDYNMFNRYGDDVNIPVEKPIIDRIVDVATSLPETGAAQYALVVLFLGMSVYFFVRNRQLTNELAAATVEYQHQASSASMAEAQTLIHPEDTDTTTPQPPAAPPVA